MYAVGRLGGYISRGVYSVSGPFHPFGGAVDIIVVEQPDGSFKSSPWYVRFGKFQGVLKMKEKIVRISVNGVEASFSMYLDHKGEAYFIKEVDGCGEDGESVLSPSPYSSSSSSGDDADGQSNRRLFKSDSFNNDDSSNRSETLVSSRRSQILGFMFGRRSLERLRTEGEDGPLVGRVDSLERAEIAADLLDLNWSTSLATKKKKKRKEVGSRFLTRDSSAANLDDDGKANGDKDQDRDESKEKLKGEEETAVDLTEYVESMVDLRIGSSGEASESSDVKMELLASTEQYSESIVDDANGKKLEINFESEHCARGDLSRPINIPKLESSEEIQFIFSDLDEFEASKSREVGGGGAELSNDADEGSLNRSSENLNEETAAFANKETKSSSIPISHTRRNGEFKQLVESMPITRSDIKNLESYVFQVPLSQSLDVNSNTLEFIKNEKHLGKQQLNIEDIHLRPSVEMDVDAAAESFDAEKHTETVDKAEPSLDEGSSPKVMGGSWRLWPFSFNKSRSANNTGDVLDENTVEKNNNSVKAKVVKKMARVTTPTSEQLASLNLKQGSNSVVFTFSTAMLGNQRVEARIYLWKWNSRIIISDVDGTITKSDVLGQFMPFVGMDWSHTGVTHLFSAIKENGYHMLFLSARAISQAYLTRQFLFNLKQNGKCLPEGPVVISPDGLFPSLYREVIRRAPHEFKIACLEDIKALFPPDCNPFYAGFGNRHTDEISYLKVGIPKGKIFTINPKGQVAVNRHINTKSYTSLHALVHGMFPHVTISHEQEAYNSWNFWKLPTVDIDM